MLFNKFDPKQSKTSLCNCCFVYNRVNKTVNYSNFDEIADKNECGFYDYDTSKWGTKPCNENTNDMTKFICANNNFVYENESDKFPNDTCSIINGVYTLQLCILLIEFCA